MPTTSKWHTTGEVKLNFDTMEEEKEEEEKNEEDKLQVNISPEPSPSQVKESRVCF